MTMTTHSHKAWTDKGGHVSPLSAIESFGPGLLISVSAPVAGASRRLQRIL
jgi:hypothetical protein